MRILVTGGTGFIGANFVHYLLRETDADVLNVDKLTYAANELSVAGLEANARYQFRKIDVCDRAAIVAAVDEFQPDTIVHFAAESHVDRSIDAPAPFVRTNVVGTATLLDALLAHHLAGRSVRFVHVSTDEVFGSLGGTGMFSTSTPYAPRSPYAASKAGADHLVRAWHETYGLPTVVTNSSNNYGPYQFPEKLIPLMILKGLANQPLPIFGTGKNIRDWLHTEDHVRALWAICERGRPGETYLVGGRCEKTNLEIVEAVCDLLDEMSPQELTRRDRIAFVEDRPGHDFRYAIDPAKLEQELGWKAQVEFSEGLRRTVRWYLDNADWWQPLWDGRYGGERLGRAHEKN